MSVIAFLRDFKSAYDVRNIHDSVSMWFFKQVLSGAAEATVKSRISLPNSRDQNCEGGLR